MYQGKKISVAMATYNGEKYIREQLESILNQTVVPDEIVVSDDGSSDHTLEIIQSIVSSPLGGNIEITVLTDNMQHGSAYNFAYALRHVSGDIVFLADQDDIWMPEKVLRISQCFLANADAQLVFHNAVSVDAYGKPFDCLFSSMIQTLAQKCAEGESIKLPRSEYCHIAASSPFVNGMVMACSRKLLDTAFPFPRISNMHDGWLFFCSEVQDSCFYLNLVLTQRRLHENNVTVSYAQRNIIKRALKVLHQIPRHKRDISNRYIFASCMKAYYMKYCPDEKESNNQAQITIQNILKIGEAELDAGRSGRISGAIKLIRLYRHNMRYRSAGTKAFLYELADIILRSKKKRVASIMESGL